MATFAQCAPTAPVLELKDDHTTQALSLTLKILEESIPETHKSCITNPETFKLNSNQNGTWEVMAKTIGIKPPPVLKLQTKDFTLETSLTKMSEGLQQHQALLKEVFPRLNRNERLDGLLSDISDLLTQIHTMVTPHVQPTLEFNLPQEFEVQVATHLALVQLQSFGCDMVRILRHVTADEEEVDASYQESLHRLCKDVL